MPEFLTVARTDEIGPGQAKLVEVDGNEIAIFNIDGSYHAIDNTCSHVGDRCAKARSPALRLPVPGMARCSM